ncbi:viral A-type inclusion protein [Spirosoma sp. KNUC1025]|uniref:viral A-type inclusion protein n=1 Tax=Spirosoma sp. KNUC1025 TaxID=2894082 RepID=UPI00386E99E3|nr:viral A-type inclusion protein [Spirosoma sp. KNUC1025]
MHKFLLIATGLISCTSLLCSCNSNENAIKESEDEVIAIHDEVMHKTGSMVKLQKKIKQRIASLDSLKSVGSASSSLRIDEEREQAVRLSRDLKAADSLMYYWMDHYKGDTLTKLSSDDALKYLAAQKDFLTDVQAKYNASLEQATQFLGKK